MAISQELLKILLLLFPGLIITKMLETLSNIKKKNDLNLIINSLLYSIAVYIIYIVIFKRDITEIKLDSLVLNYSYVLWILLISLLVGFFVTVVYNNDFPMNLLRRLGVTKKTVKDDVWLDVFYNLNGYIMINFKDGRRLLGWPSYFPNIKDENCIYLNYAAWLENDEYLEVDAEGIIVNINSDVDYIEIFRTNMEEENE